MSKLKQLYLTKFCNCEGISCDSHFIFIDDCWSSCYHEEIMEKKDTIIILSFDNVNYKVFHDLLECIIEMPNLTSLSIPETWKPFISGKIALLQNLKQLYFSGKPAVIDFKDNYNDFIHQDKMLIYKFTDKTLIPAHIKFLNITEDSCKEKELYLLQKIPDHIEHLTFSVSRINKDLHLNFKIPSSLKTFNFHVSALSYKSEIPSVMEFLKKLKYPKGCKKFYGYDEPEEEAPVDSKWFDMYC